MQKQIAALAAVLATVACIGPVQAHHSGFMYETTPLWIKGTVSSFEKKQPHSILTLEEKGANGKVQRWIVEGPPQNALERQGVDTSFLKIGDVIQSCAFPYKKEHADKAPTADADGTPRRAVAGHVLVLPNGEKHLWEPHGILSECIRTTTDQPESWLGLVKANLSNWCEQRKRPETWLGDSKSYAEKIDNLLGSPCK